MSNAVSGIGMKLQKGNAASPEVFAGVSEVRSIKWDNRKLDTVDVTNMDSTGNYREVLPTLFDPGELSFEMNNLESTTDTSQASFETDYENRVKRNFKLIFPTTGVQTTGAQYAFTGYITEFSKDFAIDKQQIATCKIKITGKPTFTAGS